MECWNLLVIYVAAACTWASTDVSSIFQIVVPQVTYASETMWTLLSYLHLDVLELGALVSGLRLSVCLFSGLAAAVGKDWLIQAYVDSRSLLLRSTGYHLERLWQLCAA
jgi:hypothetical protein